MILLSSPLSQEIRAHGEREYPLECCGVLLGHAQNDQKTVTELRPLANVHEDGHERRFLISPDDMFRLEREMRAAGLKILGFYHSHPDHPARPSEYDRDWAWPWYSYIITAVANGAAAEMTSWVLREDRAAYDEEQVLIRDQV